MGFRRGGFKRAGPQRRKGVAPLPKVDALARRREMIAKMAKEKK